MENFHLLTFWDSYPTYSQRTPWTTTIHKTSNFLQNWRTFLGVGQLGMTPNPQWCFVSWTQLWWKVLPGTEIRGDLLVEILHFPWYKEITHSFNNHVGSLLIQFCTFYTLYTFGQLTKYTFAQLTQNVRITALEVRTRSLIPHPGGFFRSTKRCTPWHMSNPNPAPPVKREMFITGLDSVHQITPKKNEATSTKLPCVRWAPKSRYKWGYSFVTPINGRE